nr:MFS transporter [Shinella yambaruensis]
MLALGAFATGTDAQVISGILPRISADLSVSLDTAGGVVSVYSVTYAVSAPILAALTVHIRRDRAAVLALAVFTIANALCALAPTFAMLIGARILAGLSGGLFIPTAYALAAGLAPPERKGAALSVIAFGITGAIVAGVPLGILVGDGFGWHAAFWLVTGISAVALVGIAMLVPPPPATPSAATLPQRFAPLAHAPTLLALLPTLLCLGLNGGVYTYLGAMLHERGYSTGITLAAFSLFGLGALTGSQLGGRLADRYGPLRPMFIALAVSVIVGLLVPRALGALWSIGLVSFALGAAPWPIVLGQQQRLMALAPRHVEVVLALNNSFVYFGIAVGTALGGWILARGFGLDAIATACAAFPVMALVSLLASEGLSRVRGSTGQ